MPSAHSPPRTTWTPGALQHRTRGVRDPHRAPDRGKYGSKIHLICDRNGLPNSVAISGANLQDSQALEPLVMGIPPLRSRRGPRRRRPAKLHGDKGNDYDHLRKWLRKRGHRPTNRASGGDGSARLGRHCWVVERTMSWLSGCRRLHRRYERKREHFNGFTAIAVMLIRLRCLGVSAGR
ncbi:IS5 family transposase [Streptomyces sp. NPDC052301]|uniref:IS5 family transposase n=1 Tax=Streptomyces sp. NPDC052301 TaxID=3365687 RepID=UPI0037CDB55C